jgi:tRNA (adenine37-N6)-methyltransferase
MFDPIAIVRATRRTTEDDFWGSTTSRIELLAPFDADCLLGLDEFSHLEVVFHFHVAAAEQVTLGARHPRNNPAWPRVGIFAQRAKNRPNRLGTTCCRLLSVAGTALEVAELDAIDGTPVFDLKPVMREFLPRTEVRQPTWATELMTSYWKTR